MLARFDFNVPMDDGKVTDDFRIKSAIPSIQYMLGQGARRVVLVCHFGRPKGADKKLSVEFMCPMISDLLGKKVQFLEDGVSQKTLDRLAAEEGSGEGAGAVYVRRPSACDRAKRGSEGTRVVSPRQPPSEGAGGFGERERERPRFREREESERDPLSPRAATISPPSLFLAE